MKIRTYDKMSKPRICVVGAGVSGLSTAYYLLSEVKEQFNVEIIAEHFTPNTTSNVAFGMWEPYLVADTPGHKIRKWSQETIEHMVNLANSQEASKAGAFVLSGHSIFTRKPEDPSWKNDAVDFRHLTDKELKLLYPDFKYGWSWTSAACECKYYLPYLMDKIIKIGGRFHKKKINSLEELYGDYDVIVNCAGVGARDLASDYAVKPIKGQIIRVKAPWLKRFLMADDIDLYIIPGRDFVVLGGTHGEGDWSTDVCQSNKSRIFEGCCKIIPSLGNAEFIEDCVGLRPGRSKIRVEAETVKLERNGQIRQQKIVHNYGHGGSGIGLHWGCAKEAAGLVLQSLIPQHKL